MKEQLVAERYQAQLFSDVVITREEVFVFYNNYKDRYLLVLTSPTWLVSILRILVLRNVVESLVS